MIDAFGFPAVDQKLVQAAAALLAVAAREVFEVFELPQVGPDLKLAPTGAFAHLPARKMTAVLVDGLLLAAFSDKNFEIFEQAARLRRQSSERPSISGARRLATAMSSRVVLMCGPGSGLFSIGR